MTRALMLLLYADSSARFYQSVEWAGRTSSRSRSRPEPVAQGVRTILEGDEEGGSDDGILGRSRREAGISAEQAAEVGYPFEAPPGMDTPGLQDPVCHAGDVLGLLAARSARYIEVGHLREDLQVGLDQGAAYGVCPGKGREECRPGELAGDLEVPGVLSGQGVACRGEAHRVAERGIFTRPERVRQRTGEGLFAAGHLQRPRKRCYLVVTQVCQDTGRWLFAQGAAGQRRQIPGNPRVGVAGQRDRGACRLEYRLPHTPASRPGESIPDGQHGERLRLVRDAAVEVAGSRPRSRGAVDEHHGRRGAGRNETLGYVLCALMLHSGYGVLSRSADTNTSCLTVDGTILTLGSQLPVQTE